MKKYISLLKDTIFFLCTSFLLLFVYIVCENFSVGEERVIVPSLAPMLSKVLPAVVSVHVEGFKKVKRPILPKEFRYFFGPDLPNFESDSKPFEGLGSGVIINSEKGYIITNNHVINGANKIKIQINDGREYEAKLIGQDEQTDLALLQLSNPKNLISVKIADSDLLKVGDFAVAVGNPFGIGQTATSGIISALGRSGLNIEGLENFIQTDASINRGNSGGALVNLNGELIGINTAILAPGGGNIGIGFAIPSNIVKSLSQQLINFGEIRRGQLGIKGTELTSDIAQAFNIEVQRGAFVSEVLSGSAAEKSGIKAGDVIISIDGKKIQNFAELRVKIATTIPGTTIKVGLIRNGKTKFISLILDDKNVTTADEIFIPSLQGVSLSNVRCKNGERGIEVIGISKDSPSSLFGLQKGDIIIGLNKKRIENILQLRKALSERPTVSALLILRNGSSMYLILQ